MSNTPRVFAYIIRTVGVGYHLKGAVPGFQAAKSSLAHARSECALTYGPVTTS